MSTTSIHLLMHSMVSQLKLLSILALLLAISSSAGRSISMLPPRATTTTPAL